MHHSLYISLFTLLLGMKEIHSQNDDLFLTPLIKGGDLNSARNSAQQNLNSTGILPQKNLETYAGYLTVDEDTNSNLYFIFHPVKENPQGAPLILWINNIPGNSLMREVIFGGAGPFEVGEDGRLVAKNESWSTTQSILFIDTPVGTGFSFTGTERDYANTAGEESVQLYEALRQFYTLFPEMRNLELFIAGENFAASEIPLIVNQIEMGNLHINFKGAIVGSPFISLSQFNYGEALLDLGLIDENQKKFVDQIVEKKTILHGKDQHREAFQLYLDATVGPNSLLAQTTGFESFSNALKSEIDPKLAFFDAFVNSREFQEIFHVGTHKFVQVNLEALGHLANDLSTGHERIWEEMLNKGYRVLFYAPQFNLFAPTKEITRVVYNFQWKGAKGFCKSPRKIWKVNGEVAGYVKQSENFSYAIVRNAGNSALLDQPTWMLDLMKRFVYSKGF